MRKLLVSFACATLLGVGALAAGINPKYASAPGLKEYPSSDVLVLSESREYTVEPDGRVTESYFRAEKILTYQGMDLVGDPHVPFNKEAQEIKDYALTTYTPDGRTVEAKANSFNEMTPYELEKAPTYTAWREMVMTKVGLDLGAVVETRYVISDKRPWRRFFDRTIYFGGLFPCLERVVKVTVPKDVALRYAFENGDARPDVGDAGSARSYTWHVNNSRQVDVRQADMEEREALPRLVVTTCKNWGEANAYAGALADKAIAQGSEEINRKTAELVKAAETAFGKVQAIHDYVAEDIPTVEWPAELAGFEPRPAAEVFRAGYGYALDKAVLLCAMLKRIGVEAAPAACALSLPGVNDVDAVPCLAQMDHILVHAAVDGKTLWLDPCAKLSERSQRDFQDYKGLPLTAGYGDLHVMPPPATASRLETSLRVEMTKEFSFTGEGAFVFSGDYSTYYSTQGSQAALKAAAEEWLGAVLPGAEVVSSNVNVMAPEQVSVAVTFKGAAKETAKGMRSFATGLPVASIIAHPREIYRLTREFPLVLPFAGREEMRLSLKLPDGMKPAYIPGALKSSGPGGSATQEWSLDGNKIKMTLAVEIPGRVVKQADYPAFRDLCTSVAAESARTALFLDSGK